MTSLRLACLHLARKPLSSAIAAIAVAASVACGGTLLRLYELSGSRFSSLARGPDAIVGAKSGGIEILLGALNLEGPYPGFLPLKLFESLRAQQKVRFEDGADSQPDYLRGITPFLFFARIDGARVIATDESFLANFGGQLASGRWGGALGEAVVGSAVAGRLGLKPGDFIEAEIWLENPDASAPRGRPRAMKLAIVGALAPFGSAWDRGVFSNLATAREALGNQRIPGSIWGPDVLHYFLATLKPNGMKPLVDLVNKRTVSQVASVTVERAALEALTGSGRSLGLIVMSLIIALAGLCMLTLMIVRFDAMSSQIAVLRAIGYLRREIGAWLLLEGAMLGCAGCAVGAAIDGMLFPTVRALLGSALPDETIAVSALWQSWPVWVAALCAVVASVVFPIWRTYRQDIQASLKG